MHSTCYSNIETCWIRSWKPPITQNYIPSCPAGCIPCQSSGSQWHVMSVGLLQEGWQVLRCNTSNVLWCSESPICSTHLVFRPVCGLPSSCHLSQVVSPEWEGHCNSCGPGTLYKMCSLYTAYCTLYTGTLFEKAEEVSWWMLCLGRSQGQNPRGRRPQGFWPRDLPRHNIHHDTSKAFS